MDLRQSEAARKMNIGLVQPELGTRKICQTFIFSLWVQIEAKYFKMQYPQRPRKIKQICCLVIFPQDWDWYHQISSHKLSIYGKGLVKQSQSNWKTIMMPCPENTKFVLTLCSLVLESGKARFIKYSLINEFKYYSPPWTFCPALSFHINKVCLKLMCGWSCYGKYGSWRMVIVFKMSMLSYPT